jgi:hypothetical protein
MLLSEHPAALAAPVSSSREGGVWSELLTIPATAKKNVLDRSGTHSALVSFPGIRLDGKPNLNRLRRTDTRSQNGGHIGLCNPLPDHRPSIKVGTLTHCLAGLVIIQQLDRRFCDGRRTFKRHQKSASMIEYLCGVPIWSRDDGFACA